MGGQKGSQKKLETMKSGKLEILPAQHFLSSYNMSDIPAV